MAKKWRGPWIGKVTEVPTPTGTFRLKPDAITENNFFGDGGDLAYCLSIVNDVANPGYGYLLTTGTGSLLLRATFAEATSIYLDSDVVPTAIGDLPAGFFIVSAEVGSHGCLPYLGLWTPDGINDPFKMYYQFSEAIESADWEISPDDGSAFTGFAYPGYPSMAVLIAAGMGMKAVYQNNSGHIQWVRDHGGDLNGTDGCLQLRGTYYAP